MNWMIDIEIAFGLENSEVPGQTAPLEYHDLTYYPLHCLLRYMCPETKNIYAQGKYVSSVRRKPTFNIICKNKTINQPCAGPTAVPHLCFCHIDVI